MSARLDELLERGALASIDVALAERLSRIAGEDDDDVMLAVALASHAVRSGHVCLDLDEQASTFLRDEHEEWIVDIALPSAEAWAAALRKSALVGGSEENTPLMLDEGGRLYLRRYASYERRLADVIRARVVDVHDVDEDLLAQGLARLFPSAGADPQKRAVEQALRRGIFVIAGGPGTGKTTVVVKLLALLQEQALAKNGSALTVRLLAPTGKAAQRLGEAVEAGLVAIDVSAAVRGSVPTSASTIHRALGFRPRTPTRFRHGPSNPLPDDVVIVDEASMVDLGLMTKLLEAVRPGARVVLLGDKDQLASVEAGAVLGDLYVASQSISALGECVALLEHSYRYDADRGIGALARAIQAADADGAMAAFGTSEVRLCPPDEKLLPKGALWQEILAGFRPCLEASDPHQRLSALADFRVLCAHRRGPTGVEQLNPLIVHRLAESGLIEPRGAHFDGRPILIRENDARQGLFNGDVGIICRDEGRLWAYFPSPEASGVRRFACPLLPAHETAFAMTVHKSQGSEFRAVAVVMPSRVSPVVTRELIYTAISRARERVVVYAEEAIVRAAIARQVRRNSGLEARFRVGLPAER